MAHLLVGRAAIVPSSARRTLIVGAVSLVPVLGATCVIVTREGAPGWLTSPGAQVFTMSVWASAMLALSTTVSRVIYGLRRQANQSMQLGQYRVERLIGRGGMGTVYLARHALLRRPTALKVLEPGAAGDAAIARFEREVHATSLLTHPNTVAIYDYGRTPDARFYYAMEYLDGLDLARLVARYGPQPPARVVHVLRQVCEALIEVHGRGLIHRDLKPANIMLCERGLRPDFVKVLDFGLVREHQPSVLGLSGEHAVHGTPLYMAPESITSPGEVDVRADIYAIGAVGYFLLAGAPPFEGSTVTEVMHRLVRDRPRPPSSRLGGEVPPKLEALVLACLEKNPQRRPASAADLLAALEALALEPWTIASARTWWREASRAEPAAASPQEAADPVPPIVAMDVARRDDIGMESTRTA
jgi:serine/threonine-protein kinase